MVTTETNDVDARDDIMSYYCEYNVDIEETVSCMDDVYNLIGVD